jgi:hypothetical protein
MRKRLRIRWGNQPHNRARNEVNRNSEYKQERQENDLVVRKWLLPIKKVQSIQRR